MAMARTDVHVAREDVLTPHRMQKASRSTERKIVPRLVRLFQDRLDDQRKAVERLVRGLGLGASKVEKDEKKPPSKKEIVAAIKQAISKPIRDAFKQGIVGGAGPVARSLGIRFRESDPKVSEFLDEHMTNLEFVLDEVTAETVKEMIRDGYEEGEGEEGLIARIRASGDFAESRAQRIARTESHVAVQNGAQQAAEQAGVDKKVWMTAGDHRVRETHVEVNGQRRDIDEPFDVDGADLMFPGDPEGGADRPDLTVNCRCVTTFEYATEKAEAIDRFAKALGLEGDAMARELAREAVSWIPDAVLTGVDPKRYLRPLLVRDGSGGEESYRLAKGDVAELVLGPYASPDQVAIILVKHAITSLMTDVEHDELVDELDDVGFDVDESNVVDVVAAAVMGLADDLSDSARPRMKKVEATESEHEMRRAALVAQQYFFVASPMVQRTIKAFDEDSHPRDERGRFASSGAGSSDVFGANRNGPAHDAFAKDPAR